jgi:hypothetical protein
MTQTNDDFPTFLVTIFLPAKKNSLSFFPAGRTAGRPDGRPENDKVQK